MIVRVVLDLETMLGVVLSGLFLVMHRPKQWLSVPSINIIGWPLIVLLLFGRSAIVMTLNHTWAAALPQTEGNWSAVAIGALAVVFTGYRAVTFLRYRTAYLRAYEEARHRASMPGDA